MKPRMPLKPSLVDAYLKTARAKVHLDSLQAALETFYQSKPYAFFREEDTKRGRYIIRFDLRHPPDDLALIFGDAIGCIRASLDHVVFALASISRKAPYPEGTKFPIIDLPLNSRRRKEFDSATEHVPAAARAIIKSLQPYIRPNPAAHLLSRLNALVNIDKHRRVPVHGHKFEFRFPHADATSLKPVLVVDQEQQMITVPIQFKGQMALDPVATYDVVFGDMAVGAECNFDGIVKIYEFVANSVIPRFNRFFQ